MNEKKKTFSRVVVILLIIFILALVICTFFFSQNKYEITNNIIICLSLVIVLSLSESFDNFSVGKIISLSRMNKETKNQNEKLQEQNNNLMTQIINIKNENNVSINLEGSKNIEDIIPVNKTERIENIGNNTEINNIEQMNLDNEQDNIFSKKIDFQKRINIKEDINFRDAFEMCLLQKELMNNPKNAETQYAVRVKENNNSINNVAFDAYSKYDNKIYFYETKTTNFINMYELLYKYNLAQKYSEKIKSDFKFVLILPKMDKKLQEKFNIIGDNYYYELNKRITKTFDSKIKSDSFEISYIDISLKELEQYEGKTNK